MRPIVYGLDLKYHDQVNFIYLDIADPNTLALRRELGLFSTPHFFLLDPSGEIISQWIGVVSGNDMEKAIQDAIRRQ